MSTSDHVEKSPEPEWNYVLEYLNTKVRELGRVTLPEVAIGLGVSEEKAREYMDKLVDSGDWERGLTRRR